MAFLTKRYGMISPLFLAFVTFSSQYCHKLLSEACFLNIYNLLNIVISGLDFMLKKVCNIGFLLLFLLSLKVNTQSFNPVITNFNKNDYKAASQNWGITQDENGFIYAGNNNGLLQFDGYRWSLLEIPELKTIRSVMVGAQNRVYVGSFEEFGFFKRDSFGVLNYYSLTSLISGYRFDNDEIWSIFEMDGKIVFQSFSSFFTYDGQQVEGFKLSENVIFFMPWNKKVYAYINSMGLCTVDLNDGSFKKVEGCKVDNPIISILPHGKNEALVFTLDNGIYLFDGANAKPFTSEATEQIKEANVNKTLLTKDSLYVIGTLHDGLFAIDTEGKLKWHLGTSQGMQNNTVLGLFEDVSGNVWSALDKGISVVKSSSGMQFFNQFGSHIGAIYDIAFTKNRMYIGTNQGLYSCNKNDVFRGINIVRTEAHPGIRKQVWDISAIDGQLFCGNNEETYELTETGYRMVSPVQGGMSIKKGFVNGTTILVQGTYSNLCIYLKNSKGEWTFSHTVDSFINPIRYVEIDYMGTIWASHIHKGLFAIKLNNDLKTIREITYFDRLGNSGKRTINVFLLNQRVVFCDGEILYTFDDLEGKIVPYDVLNNELGVFRTAHRIIHFAGNRYWFIRHFEAALVEVGEKSSKIVDIVPFAFFPADHVDEHQNIVPVSDDVSLFCFDNALGLYSGKNNSVQSEKRFADIIITKVEVESIRNRAQTQLLTLNNSEPVILAHHQNKVMFSIAYPDFIKDKGITFSLKLTGEDDFFSQPGEIYSQEYGNLSPGEYFFEAIAVNRIGNTVSSAGYSFTIKQPYYFTPFAFVVYFILFFALLLVIIRTINKYFIAKQVKIEEEHIALRKKEREEREKQIMKLKNENLEAELKYKSKELASSAMMNIRKNDILLQIKGELEAQKEHLGIHYPQKYLKKVLGIIDNNIGSEADWEVFQQSFDRIHENFFRSLKSRYPDLTPHDLRFCVYLRLNLSSKEIANLLNISLKGVEISRYRIRKKLGLDQKESLNDFLLNL